MIKESFPWIVITATIFVLSLTAKRYVWPFYYLATPFLAVLISRLNLEQKKYISAFALGAAFFITVVAVTIKIPFNKYTNYSWENYCQVRLCSSEAADFLISHHLNTDPNLLTQYDLGGWLIWNYYPRIKPTIDGRMTLWIGDNGYNPLQEYVEYENNIKDIDQSKYDVVFTSTNKSFMLRFVQLVKQGKWKIAYVDHHTAILVRAHTSRS